MSLRSDLEAILKDLMSAAGGDLLGCGLVRADGLPVVSIFSAGIDERRAAAMGATALGTATRLCGELDRGAPRRLMIEGERGNVVIMSVGGELLLIALSSENPNLGLLFMELERAAKRVEEVMGKRRGGK